MMSKESLWISWLVCAIMMSMCVGYIGYKAADVGSLDSFQAIQVYHGQTDSEILKNDKLNVTIVNYEDTNTLKKDRYLSSKYK